MHSVMPNVDWRPRPAQRAWAGLAILAVLLAACTGKAAAGDHQPPAERVAGFGVPPSPPPVSQPVDLSAATLTTSLRDVLASGLLVGRRVRVTGRCLAARRALLGKPPRARSEWQLSSDGVYVYVTGPLPPGCGPSTVTTVTILAVVAEDTLPAIADLPPAPRRFLVYGGGPDQ